MTTTSVTIKGNMAENDRLKLWQQDDGDIIIEVIKTNGKSESIEFAAPHTRHRRTFHALYVLMDAIADDVKQFGNGEIDDILRE